MRKSIVILFLSFALVAEATWAQSTCQTATPLNLPLEQSQIDTMASDTWGFWGQFELSRPALIEISGSPCYVPGWARAELWSECDDGDPPGSIGGWETPSLEAGFFTSGQVPLPPGTYYVELRTFCVVDFDTLFYGDFGIDATYMIDVDVLSSVNPRRRGVVPVAIFGSEQLDLSMLNLATLRLGPGQAAPAHDLSEAWALNEHAQDLNGDGFMDLIVHFEAEGTGLDCGDASAVLTAKLADGSPLVGEDAIHTIGCGPRRLRN